MIYAWASNTPDKQPLKYEVGKNRVVNIVDISVDKEGIWERGYKVEFDDGSHIEIWGLPGVVYFKGTT